MPTSRSKTEISILIATKNPRALAFARTLESIKKQSIDLARTELIVIDNGSTPPVSELIDLKWHPNASIHVEPKPGRAHAIALASTLCRGPVTLFVDDDNELALDYIETGISIFKADQRLGAWAGQLIPEFEHPASEDNKKHLHMLAIREFGEPKQSADGSVMPAGAGCFIRTELLQNWAELFSRDMIRQQLGSRFGLPVWFQEDVDIGITVLHHKFELGIFPQLRLRHLIAGERTSSKYLLKLSRNNGAGTLLTKWLWFGVTNNKTRFRLLIDYLRLWRLPKQDRLFAIEFWRGERLARQFIRKNHHTRVFPRPMPAPGTNHATT